MVNLNQHHSETKPKAEKINQIKEQRRVSMMNSIFRLQDMQRASQAKSAKKRESKMILLDDLKEEDRSTSSKKSGSKSSMVTETSQSFVSHVTGKKPSPNDAESETASPEKRLE